MARKRYTAEQIVAILREAERDANAQETCRRHGISEQTFYRWRKMYGDLGASQVQQMKALVTKLGNVVVDLQRVEEDRAKAAEAAKAAAAAHAPKGKKPAAKHGPGPKHH